MHGRHAGHGAQREVVTVSGAPTAHDVDMAVGRVVNGTVRSADGTELHGALVHAVPTGDGVGHVPGPAPDGSYSLPIPPDARELAVWGPTPTHPARRAGRLPPPA